MDGRSTVPNLSHTLGSLSSRNILVNIPRRLRPYLESPRMGRFTPRYSGAQRRGIVRAVVDGGMSCPEAVAAASEGLIPHPDHEEERLPAYTFDVGTLRQYAREERRRRTGDKVPAWISDGEPDEVIDRLARRTLAIAAQEIGRQERKAAPDLARLKGANAVLREARALIRGEAPSKAGTRTTTPKGPGDATDAAHELAQRVREVRAGQAPRVTTEETTEAERGAAGQEAEAGQAGGERGSGILTRVANGRATEARAGAGEWAEVQAKARQRAEQS
jgi:hypothetical protein